MQIILSLQKFTVLQNLLFDNDMTLFHVVRSVISQCVNLCETCLESLTNNCRIARNFLLISESTPSLRIFRLGINHFID